MSPTGSRTEILFLYGSLLQQTGNQQVDRIMSRFSRPLYRGYILGRLYDLGQYPGVIESAQENDRVFGQLVELSRAGFILPQLDKFEDYRPKDAGLGQYIRKRIKVYAQGKKTTSMAWCYIYNQPVNEDKWIRGGDWLQHCSHRTA